MTNLAYLNLSKTAFLLTVITSLVLLSYVLRLSNVGIDLTDEGYYLNWISNPWIYKFHVSQFGYVYHGLFNLVGNSIAGIRQGNTLISFGLAWILSYLVLWQASSAAHQSIDKQKLPLIAISFCIAIPALFILMITGRWVPTPSYNSLNFQGYLVALIGVLLANKPIKLQNIFSWILIGIGGWLSFMAKPPSAAILGIVICLYFLLLKQFNWRLVAIAVIAAACMLLISAMLIDGSVLAFIHRIQMGVKAVTIMGGAHGIDNLFRLDAISLIPTFKFKLIIAAIFFTVAAVLTGTAFNKLHIALAVIAIFFTMTALLIIAGVTQPDIKVKPYHVLILLSLPLGISTGLIGKAVFQNKIAFKQHTITLSILLIALPYCYAIGTANNYWTTAAGAGVFWVLAGLNLVVNLKTPVVNWVTLTPFLTLLTLLSTNVLVNSIASPYRQTMPLRDQTHVIQSANNNESLYVPNDVANYIGELRSIAIKAGFESGMPVIDFTGRSPGALYLLKAKAIGQAWTIGAYPGSSNLARFALDHVPCDDIARAWLLIETDGTRRISGKILEKDGIEINKKNYRVVGKFLSNANFWGKNPPEHANGIYTQLLAKPIDSNQLENLCNTARNR